MSSQGKDSVAGGQTPKARRKGGRIVQSRYLQFGKKDSKKVSGLSTSGVAQRKAEKDASSSSSLSSTLLSCRPKERSVLSRKHETSASVDHVALNQSGFEKGNLQSTLLDEEKTKLPDLDISAINDKSDPEKRSRSESTSEEASYEETDCEDLIEELESETLLLTFLRLKVGKRIAKLEEKAEKNLLMLCEEKRKQQEMLWELKREILLQEREEKLNEALDKQIEVLTPLVAICEPFKEQYKSFAASLDATRHELLIKNIHIEGDKQAYLDELGEQLMIAQQLLAEVLPNPSEDSAKALGALKELQEVSQQLSQELQRSFTDVQDLSFEACKEVSLHNQNVCEEHHGVDVVKHWYFN